MDEQILKWVADYCQAAITREDFLKLQEWVEKCPENRDTFEKLIDTHHEVRTLFFLQHADNDKAWKRLEGHFTTHKNRRSLILKWSVAASFILFIGTALTFILNREKDMTVYPYSDTVLPGSAKAVLVMSDGKKVNLGPGYVQHIEEKDGTQFETTEENILVYNPQKDRAKQIFHTIEVPVGGEYSLQLADGSRVWLNSATTMRYPVHFSGKNREVYISGEAYFEVSKDSGHPFIVHAGESSVKVLGTEFNLSAYPEECRLITTLKSGKVEFVNGKRKVALAPGHQVIFHKEDASVRVREVDASLYTAWIRGVFEFENLSLGQISVQLSRWYGVQFVFVDSSLSERYFTGGVKKYNTLRESLDFIENTTNVHFEIVEKNVFVTSR